MEIYGYCDERFTSLREEFERNFTERGDVGASFAASVDGELVVDIWGGHRNEAKNASLARTHHRECVFYHQNNDRVVRAHVD